MTDLARTSPPPSTVYEEALSPPSGPPVPAFSVHVWLLAFLRSSGPTSVSKIYEAAEQFGLKQNSVRQACKRHQEFICKEEREDGWYWSLAPDADPAVISNLPEQVSDVYEYNRSRDLRRQAILFKSLMGEDGTPTTLAEACRRAGLSYREVIYRRDHDPVFGEKFLLAETVGTQRLEQIAIERGTKGHEEEVFYNGARCYETNPFSGKLKLDEEGKPIPLKKRTPSDTLLNRVLAARDARYRNNSQIEHTGPGGGPLLVAFLETLPDD